MIASILWIVVPLIGVLQKSCEDIITNTSKNARTYSA